jgi:hypothetical protein
MLHKPSVPAPAKRFGILGIYFDYVIVVVDRALAVATFLAKESALSISQHRARISPNRLGKIGDGASKVMPGASRLTAVEVIDGLIGIQRECAGEISDRQIPLGLGDIGHSSIRVSGRKFCVEIYGLTEISDSVVTIAQC